MRAKLLLRTPVLASLLLISLISPADTIEIKRLPQHAEKATGLQDNNQMEFSPAISEDTISIPFAIQKQASVTVDIMSPDGDLVRRLTDKQPYRSGTHKITWDGRDDDGTLVPDETYMPLFRAVQDEDTFVDNPATYSGGEIISNLDWQRSTETSISYTLPAAARVLVRIGVKDGPMMRELRHWKPAVAGKVVDRWNGYDVDNVEYFANREDLWVVVKAYELPQYSVIATGNKAIDYRTYRKKRGWPPVIPDINQIKLQRDGIRLSRDYFMPREYLPRVSLEFESELPVSRVGLPEVRDTVRFKINVPDEDRWILDSSFYETGLYVNYQFQSEEEQGFVPMIWQYDAGDLPPGRHIATVQLFGFGGFISSSTLEFLKQ